MKGYFASHFFNDAMFRWTEDLARFIEKEVDIDLYVPQRNDSINNKKDNDATITDIDIARNDMAKLKEADVLIACLDGLSIDDGVAGEIMAFSVMKDYEEEYKLSDKKRIIIGFVTDMRYLGTGENKLYRNQMIVGQVKDKGYFLVGYPNTGEYKKEIVDIIKREY